MKLSVCFKMLLSLALVHLCCTHNNFAFLAVWVQYDHHLLFRENILLSTLSGIILHYVCISTHIIAMLFEMTARKSVIFSDQRLHFYQILKSICPHHLILFVVAVKKPREKFNGHLHSYVWEILSK